MEFTQGQARKFKTTGFLILIGAFVGPFYVVFSDGFSSLSPYFNAFAAGILIALNIAFFEFVIFAGKVKRLPFYQLFTIRVVLYVISILFIILCVLIFSRMIKYDLNFYEVLLSDEFREYIQYKDFFIVVFYAFAIVALTNFAIQMNRKMGQGILIDLITGRYYRPKKAIKVVMFLKILKTQELIESVGRLNYHRFLKEVIYDLTEVILSRHGVVYEYVDDELVLTWNPARGFSNANCIRAFFEMQEKLEAKKEVYYEKFRFLPVLVASIHVGEVIIGEIGDIKSEIKYLGDLMNTTYRILGMANSEQKLLCTAELMESINLPIIYDFKEIGQHVLKGKSKPVTLYHLFDKKLKSY